MHDRGCISSTYLLPEEQNAGSSPRRYLSSWREGNSNKIPDQSTASQSRSGNKAHKFPRGVYGIYHLMHLLEIKGLGYPLGTPFLYDVEKSK